MQLWVFIYRGGILPDWWQNLCMECMEQQTFRRYWDLSRGLTWLGVYRDSWRTLFKKGTCRPWWRRRPFGLTFYGRIPDAWYWLKCRLWHRHNVVVCSTLQPTWSDPDEKLLHASFQILCDLVEKEDLFNRIVCFENAGSTPVEIHQEIAQLWDWWRNVRPHRPDPTDWYYGALKESGLTHTSLSDTEEQSGQRGMLLRLSSHMEEAQYDEDSVAIIRLARVRAALWT